MGTPLGRSFPGGWRGGAEMRLVSRIAAAISSLVALVLAGGAAWKI
jgi:predicted secreted protein